ncbi:MAG: methylated-DNA--[protein]-cysteine S-methyltransferase [Bacteroidia bacterium]
MSFIVTSSYFSPVGELRLGSFEGKLCLADWQYRSKRNEIDNRISRILNAEFEEGTTPILDETKKQLDAYFRGDLEKFSIPLLMAGTDFQKNVWSKLMEIHYGTTWTYLQLSRFLQNEKGIRAVASANGANAISIIVPCHRIIGSDGSLVGYAGGLRAKKKLLVLENPQLDPQIQLFDA